MSTHKHIDRICCIVLALTLLVTLLLLLAARFRGTTASASVVMGYERKLFDTSQVHTINIIMDDWDAFLADCQNEEYTDCTVIIDGETFKNVAIRAKGNTSLTQVASYGNNRYSFKIEFDHYDSSQTYHGLDKLCLNNLIQDNTCMKDYLTYQMMADMGVAAPLCSYTSIQINGESWGLYLAVEGVEEAFLQRNYGSQYGALYKPDSMSMGGGRGNGKEFDMEDLDFGNFAPADTAEHEEAPGGRELPEGMELPDVEGFSGGQTPPDGEGFSGDLTPPDENGVSGLFQNEDVLLQYIDDDPASYPNLFDNAKTAVSQADKSRLIASLKNLSEGVNLTETLDVEAVIRYFVVHNFVLNFDSYTGSMIHNYYLYEENGQLSMIPWDYNLAFGGFQSAEDATALINYPIDSPVSGGSMEERPMLAWIFENEEYLALYHQYFAEWIADYFDSGYFAEMIDQVSAMISPYVEADPTCFCTYEEFQTGVSTLKQFCLLRAESISGQLDGSIGATSDTQESDTLIGDNGLKISDMGSMNNSMGMGFPQNPGEPQQGFSSGDDTPPEQPKEQGFPSGDNTPPEQPEEQGFPSGDNTPPEQPEEQGFSGSKPSAGDFSGGFSSADARPNDRFSGGEPSSGMPEAGGKPSASGFSSGMPTEKDAVSTAFRPDAKASGSLAAPLLLLILCAVVLAAGLFLVRIYKRRR